MTHMDLTDDTTAAADDDDLGTLHFAGWVAMANVVLHAIAPIFGGLAFPVPGLLIGGVVWAVIGFGLLRQRRWLAMIAFVLALAGALVAYGLTGTSAVPEWLTLAIVAADALIALSLFVHLWRR